MIKFKYLLVFVVLFLVVGVVQVEWLKDIVSIQGVWINQLIGYGLVVGLSGSGDQIMQMLFILQIFNNMLVQFGIKVLVNVGNVQLKNVVVVLVYVDLLLFVKLGQLIDVIVLFIGNVKSLCGGSLLMILLKGIDGQVYVVVQGNLVVGGFDVEGCDGLKIIVNVLFVGCILVGVIVECVVLSGFDQGNSLMLNFNCLDFIIVKCIVDCINELFGLGVVYVVDGGLVWVSVLFDLNQWVDYLLILENFDVQLGEVVVKVIINLCIGIIVIGQNVKVLLVVVIYGSLIVSIIEDLIVSQFGVFFNGQIVVVLCLWVNVEEEIKLMFKFGFGIILDDIVCVVNQVGVVLSDLMVIFEVLKQVGVLQVDLIVI